MIHRLQAHKAARAEQQLVVVVVAGCWLSIRTLHAPKFACKVYYRTNDDDEEDGEGDALLGANAGSLKRPSGSMAKEGATQSDKCATCHWLRANPVAQPKGSIGAALRVGGGPISTYKLARTSSMRTLNARSLGAINFAAGC